MSAPKRRRRTSKKKTTEGPSYVLGPVPDDAFGSASDAPPPRSPEAPPLTIDLRFDYLIRNPDLYATALEALPPREEGQVGRPPVYPSYIYFVFLCAISVFGSARSTAAHLARPLWWNPIRRAIHDFIDPEEAAALPPTGPTRSQWNYFFQRHLKAAGDAVRDISRGKWIEQAVAQGMLAVNPRGNWIYPAREQVLHGDATVATPPSDHTMLEEPDKKTGEIRRHRVDPDAHHTTEGGGRPVYGNKFLSIAVRAANIPHSRVILALESVRHKARKHDPHREDEGKAAVRLVKEILAKAPGVRAITYDKALRGVHRAPLIAEGLVVFTGQHSGLVPQPLQKHKCEEGRPDHDLYAAAGRVCERHITVEGETLYTPLPVRELEFRKGAQARFYQRLEIPCPHGAHTVRIRVDETKEDREIDPSTKRKRFNRTEHLRQIAPETPAGRRLKGFRQDSESQHSRLDQSYPHERVPAYGAKAALLIYIGYAWVSNSVARCVARITGRRAA
ncbi:hypothetical protein ABZX77_02635 [Streptomyces sp. NPDC004237]|uniref:hypothetical protein n=1 Tax=Streptomyces sp. NPDC004237 TaxID=3154455 RepID=UPI0033A96120